MGTWDHLLKNKQMGLRLGFSSERSCKRLNLNCSLWLFRVYVFYSNYSPIICWRYGRGRTEPEISSSRVAGLLQGKAYTTGEKTPVVLRLTAGWTGLPAHMRADCCPWGVAERGGSAELPMALARRHQLYVTRAHGRWSAASSIAMAWPWRQPVLFLLPKLE